MSQSHLTTGSTEPPKVPGKLRLYSMEYCPYAHRARLVLIAKNIPHDIVNINLTPNRKPEWFLKLYPLGKVPALDIGSEVLKESLDICDYLDENYPEPPLYPEDPAAKQRDKELIERISDITATFYKIEMFTSSQPVQEWADRLAPSLDIFENELVVRGTNFFSGDKPGMVDYMLWPWAERAKALTLLLKQNLYEKDRFVNLRRWGKEMKSDKVCSEIYHSPETFFKLLQCRQKGEEPDYDNL